MLGPGGTQLPQTTRPELVEELLELLEVREGDRVLEIGTGSGYSTALLCDLVGSEGSVVSLDVDGELVARSASMFRDDALTQAEVLVADGVDGYPRGAPYDRIVAWAASVAPPVSWREQIAPDGVIVAPHLDGRDEKWRVGSRGEHVEDGSIEAGFIPMTPEPLRPWES